MYALCQREIPSIHTAMISFASEPKVTGTYTVAVQHARRAIAWFLTVGTKVLTGHDPTVNLTADSYYEILFF